MTHSRKILSQAGTSLADSYDVEGSVVGVERLDASDVKLVHEMGGTMHAERMNSLIIRLSSTSLAQNLTWGISGGLLPDVATRILAVFVTADVIARTAFCSIALGDTLTSEECPFWTWDTNADIDKGIQWREAGAAVGTVRALVPDQTQNVPCLATRIGAGRLPQQLVFRGLTAGFGAGAVEVQANILVARASAPVPTPGEPINFGLPLPGW